LGNDHLETLIEEVSESLTVLIEVAGYETLISGIEEWVKLSLLANDGDLFPLIKGWVDTSWIVSACMEENA